MENYYRNKPMLPFIRTSVTMEEAEVAIKAATNNVEVQRALHIIFKYESAHGKSGINNNYFGFQADVGRWDEKYSDLISGVVEKKENGTGKIRLFLAFDSLDNCMKMAASVFENRGLYVGGYARKIAKMNIRNAAELAVAYKREWVTGNPNYMPDYNFVKDIEYKYEHSKAIFK